MPHDYAYRRVGSRLAMFRFMPDHKDHWNSRWSAKSVESLLQSHATGRLDEFEAPFTQYLPRHLPILEAGCGMGQLVCALQARGYDVEGVDYDSKTIERIAEVAPHLSVRCGDIFQLDVPDGHYGGYISIGVFEHDWAGPERGLLEARRVLHSDGVALITVPHLNRRRAAWLSVLPTASSQVSGKGMSFYQYYFSETEFRERLAHCGFTVLEAVPYALYSGFTRDWPVGRWLQRHRFFISRAESGVNQWCAIAPESIRRRWAHMMLYICKASSTP